MKVKLTVAQSYYHDAHLLRHTDTDRVLMYAEAMRRGDVFPDIHLGEYVDDHGIQYIVIDGVHRLKAYALAGMKRVPVTFERYRDEAHAYADQLSRNMRHGLHLHDIERDRRIKLMANKYGWTLRQIGKEVGLHFTGVGRIIRGLSEGSKTGPKLGRMHKMVAADPVKFIRIIKTCDLTLHDEQSKSELLRALVTANKPPEEIRVTIDRMVTTGKSLIALAQEAERIYAF